MTNQENIELIKDLVKLAIELGGNPLYINKLLFINGMTQQEAIYHDLLQGEIGGIELDNGEYYTVLKDNKGYKAVKLTNGVYITVIEGYDDLQALYDALKEIKHDENWHAYNDYGKP